MAMKLFILGLPGSGKSTVSRYINDYVKEQGKKWSIKPLKDYEILHGMFLQDVKGRFLPTKHQGFDVRDFSVLDMALQEMEIIASTYTLTAKSTELIIIEFARNDYIQAFKQFSLDFLHNAYFLFLMLI